MFIAVEGIDGSGKSTLVAKILDFLHFLGHQAIAVRDPYSSDLGQKIAPIIKTHEMSASSQMLMLMASRIELSDKIIRPALSKGQIVVSDRYHSSMVAYQGYGHRNLGLVSDLNSFKEKIVQPNQTLILDIPVEVAAQRIKVRGGDLDIFDFAEHDFKERVRRGYLALAEQYPKRFKVVDAYCSEGQLWVDTEQWLKDILKRY